MAIKRGGTSLEVSSLYPDKYPTMNFDTDPNQVHTLSHLGSGWRKTGDQDKGSMGRSPDRGFEKSPLFTTPAGGQCRPPLLGQLLCVRLQGRE